MPLLPQLRDGVLELTLDDPKTKNALSLSVARELKTQIEQQSFRALILRAEGRVFCSGGNLSDYASMKDPAQGRQVNDEIRAVLEQLASLERPTIAAVSGDVFGGGVELLSCFDVVIAAPHVVMALWQRKIGLSYGWGGGARLHRRMGGASLRRHSLTTESLTAHAALKQGLVDLVVQDVNLLEEARAQAKRLISLPQEPVSFLKNQESRDESASFNDLWMNDTHQSILDSRKR